MGYQIIKQPDTDPATYGVFCSYTDTIVMWDATTAEVEEFFIEIAVADARRSLKRVLDHVVAGNPREAYYQFALTWEDAIQMDREHGGEFTKRRRENG